MKFLRCLYAVCYKDLLSEVRRRENLNTLLFFSLLIVFVFSFALGTEPSLLKHISPGLLWMVVLFSSILTLDRSFHRELEDGCLDRLILYAASPRAIYLGKLATSFIFIFVVQLVVFLFMAVLYGLEFAHHPLQFFACLVLGNLGIATLGTFYSTLLVKTKARQVMLPLLLFPMLTPLILASVYATQQTLEGSLLTTIDLWMKLLIVFDIVFLVACLITIELLMEA